MLVFATQQHDSAVKYSVLSLSGLPTTPHRTSLGHQQSTELSSLCYTAAPHTILRMVTCLFGEGNGTPLQYSCLENPMDGRAWKAAVHGVTEGRTQLSDFTFTFHIHALEKEMATHSSVLAWRIPGMREPSELPSMGSHRVGHD